MIQKYLNELEARGLAKNTIRGYKLVLNTLNAYKPLETIGKDDLIGFFKQFKGTDASRMLYVVSIKAYFKSIGRPEVSAWLKVKKPKETMRSDELLTAEDVNKMIDSTDSAYWKALLALMYETGARISELLALKYGDFLQTDKGIVLTITTQKTDAGFRKMLIPLSENYFINLRDSVEHDKDNLVFGAVHYRQTFEVIAEIGRRARITKPCNPHAFRHARATDEVKKGTQEAIIRKMLGWKPTSVMIARYQHLNDEDIIESQTNGAKAAKRTELKIVEKADITPVYETLKEELQQEKESNKALQMRLDEMEAQRKKDMDKITKFIEMGGLELLKEKT